MTKENTINWFIQEKYFLVVFLICILLAGGVTGFPAAAMWLGFAFAAYSAISNDSIQTLGTFISSNLNRKWWVLWLYIGGIFLATMIWGWVSFDGDVSYGRLASKGFDEAPASLTFLQVGAPLVLLLLTRLRMPVSTSILLLSCFATEASSISRVLFKSVGGIRGGLRGCYRLVGYPRALDEQEVRGDTTSGLVCRSIRHNWRIVGRLVGARRSKHRHFPSEIAKCYTTVGFPWLYLLWAGTSFLSERREDPRGC